ncbi:MAG: sulfatase-like hydrolase/transferase [Planctomycetes bacterium]|nr:sulfatase-like hydrolase/transferase [Planctomycetota bacterium]
MDRRTFLKTLGLAAGASALPRAVHADPKKKRPNIILIMADDLSSKDMGCCGNPENKTPNLTRLGKTGANFLTCWATPICSPTRAQIMTGRYGFRTHWFHNNMKTNDPLCKDNVTLGQVFKQAGYATAIVGKWQLPGTQKAHGFDEYYMWLGGHNLWGKLRSKFDGPVEQKGQSLPGRPARYWHPALVHDGKLVDTGDDDYGPELFVKFINDYMARHKDEPFFLYFPMCLPHKSWDFERNCSGYLPTPVLDEAGNRIPGKSEPTLKANVTYIDHMVGQIVAQLDQLGIRDNTVLMFTTDNGTSGYGKAQTIQERGPRVPLIVNGPGIVKPIGERRELVQFADILPTLAALAGAKIPEDNPLDGVSFAPLLRGEPFEGRDWIFSYYADRRFLRDKRFLLDGDGKLWDCGDKRDEQGYVDVTDSTDPAVQAARKKFDALLEKLPGPDPDSPEYKRYFAWKEKKKAQKRKRRKERQKQKKKQGK